MGTSSRLATMLDADMLARNRGSSIAPPGTPQSGLMPRNHNQVTRELGGRYLLRYLLPYHLQRYFSGGPNSLQVFLNMGHYVTPTPFSPEETVPWLALPTPNQPRPYVLLLKPELIGRVILGPRWVRMGGGIEYILPDGFDQNAIVNVGAPGGTPTQWPLLVT